MFLSAKGSPTVLPTEVIRSTESEKQYQIEACHAYQSREPEAGAASLQRLQAVAVAGGNIFAELMDAVRYNTLGQISGALYEVGGQYRRNM